MYLNELGLIVITMCCLGTMTTEGKPLAFSNKTSSRNKKFELTATKNSNVRLNCSSEASEELRWTYSKNPESKSTFAVAESEDQKSIYLGITGITHLDAGLYICLNENGDIVAEYLLECPDEEFPFSTEEDYKNVICKEGEDLYLECGTSSFQSDVMLWNTETNQLVGKELLGSRIVSMKPFGFLVQMVTKCKTLMLECVVDNYNRTLQIFVHHEDNGRRDETKPKPIQNSATPTHSTLIKNDNLSNESEEQQLVASTLMTSNVNEETHPTLARGYYISGDILFLGGLAIGMLFTVVSSSVVVVIVVLCCRKNKKSDTTPVNGLNNTKIESSNHGESFVKGSNQPLLYGSNAV